MNGTINIIIAILVIILITVSFIIYNINKKYKFNKIELDLRHKNRVLNDNYNQALNVIKNRGKEIDKLIFNYNILESKYNSLLDKHNNLMKDSDIKSVEDRYRAELNKNRLHLQ